jgi:DNA-binding XRE family transcriptional regulator
VINSKKKMEFIDHKDLKNELFESEEVKEEYEKLNVMYEIKKQIIRYRIENNLTQKELADRIGTKQSAISRLENDDYNPSVELLDKVAHALGKKLEIRFN